MRERSETVLRIICLVLGALVLLQVALRVAQHDPLAGVRIPPLPALTNSTETQPGATGVGPLPTQPKSKSGTNELPAEATNASAATSMTRIGTNAAQRELAAKGTNSAKPVAANPSTESNESGAVSSAPARDSNVVASSQTAKAVKPSSNSLARVDADQPQSSSSKAGTNSSSRNDTHPKGANAAASTAPAVSGMAAPGRPGAGPKKDLPPSIQARVDRIAESELLGPIMRPLPMALLGIAGEVAFLRAPSGQTGLVKEGDELGGLKLVRIGVNRVLVEQDGQKKELSMFSGYGSESLLQKPQDSP